MIEGLKIDVPGLDLAAIFEQRAADRDARCAACKVDLAEGAATDAEIVARHGVTRDGLKDRHRAAEVEAKRLRFLARHLVATETYRLDPQEVLRHVE